MTNKGLITVLPKHFTSLYNSFPVLLLTKETKIPRGPSIDISKFYPGFILQMYFLFFNVKIIRGFTSTFVAVLSDTSYNYGFMSRSKILPLYILILIVSALRNK